MELQVYKPTPEVVKVQASIDAVKKEALALTVKNEETKLKAVDYLSQIRFFKKKMYDAATR